MNAQKLNSNLNNIPGNMENLNGGNAGGVQVPVQAHQLNQTQQMQLRMHQFLQQQQLSQQHLSQQHLSQQHLSQQHLSQQQQGMLNAKTSQTQPAPNAVWTNPQQLAQQQIVNNGQPQMAQVQLPQGQVMAMPMGANVLQYGAADQQQHQQTNQQALYWNAMQVNAANNNEHVSAPQVATAPVSMQMNAPIAANQHLIVNPQMMAALQQQQQSGVQGINPKEFMTMQLQQVQSQIMAQQEAVAQQVQVQQHQQVQQVQGGLMQNPEPVPAAMQNSSHLNEAQKMQFVQQQKLIDQLEREIAQHKQNFAKRGSGNASTMGVAANAVVEQQMSMDKNRAMMQQQQLQQQQQNPVLGQMHLNQISSLDNSSHDNHNIQSKRASGFQPTERRPSSVQSSSNHINNEDDVKKNNQPQQMDQQQQLNQQQLLMMMQHQQTQQITNADVDSLNCLNTGSINQMNMAMVPQAQQPGMNNAMGIDMNNVDKSASVNGVYPESILAKEAKALKILIGPFAGGWQSNHDLLLRRQTIMRIATLIERMQPNGCDQQKLPSLAKKLEECLYRMAKTKEEYMNPVTLKKRLQVIACALGPKKPESLQNANNNTNPSNGSSDMIGVSAAVQQRINLLRNKNQQLEGSMDSMNSMGSVDNFARPQQGPFPAPSEDPNASRGSKTSAPVPDPNSAISSAALQEMLKQRHLKPYHPAIAQLQTNLKLAEQNESRKVSATSVNTVSSDKGGKTSNGLSQKQKTKVVRQQQQRLILLRHASKCTVGPSCKIKFCAQMVKLWNHMKSCRNKDCTTPHCLSSRCVLNHYRICKAEERTSTCEVCSPVMGIIKLQDSQGVTNQSSGKASIEKDPLMPTINESEPVAQTSSAKSNDQESSRRATEASNEFTLDELYLKQTKLEQQFKLLQKLQHQLEVQSLDQQRRNISPQSEQGQNLLKQRQYLQNYHQQFEQDQILLKKLIDVHVQKLMKSQRSEKVLSQRKQRENQKSETGSSFAAVSQNEGISDNTLASIDGGVGNLEDFDDDKSWTSALFDTFDQVDDLPDESFDVKEQIHSGQTSNYDDGDEKKRKRIHSDVVDDSNYNNKISRNESYVSFENLMKLSPHDGGKDNQNDEDIPTFDSEEEPKSIRSRILPHIEKILKDPFGWLFQTPVDPQELGIPDYFDIVKEPMDLNLVKERLESGYYKRVEDTVRDVKLVFENAIQYNGLDSDVGQVAKNLLNMFTDGWERSNI